METAFSHYKSYGKFFRCSRAANSIISGPIWPKFELIWDFMHVRFTCNYKKDQIRNNREKMETLFPHYKSVGVFCCHWKLKALIQSAPKPYAAFPPPQYATHKIWSRLASWLQRYSSSKSMKFSSSRASNSKMSGLIWPKIELDQAFMPVLVTNNFDNDLIKKWTS